MPMRVISVKMPDELVEEIDLLCMKLDKNRSEFIREAVELYIRNIKQGRAVFSPLGKTLYIRLN